jgi:hypothetical protein
MRKHFIDNLRWICVLLLIPYHTCMIYNGFGENFYVRGAAAAIPNAFILICAPWFMPLLFVVAGISAKYALEKRTYRQYVRERFFKLFVPLVSGLLLIVPVQTYYAERFHNGYTGGYFEQYGLFFTKQTDLSGYNRRLHTGAAVVHPIPLRHLVGGAAVYHLVQKKQAPAAGRRNDGTAAAAAVSFDIGTQPRRGYRRQKPGYYFAFFILGYLVLSGDPVQRGLHKTDGPYLQRWLF